MNIQNKDIIQCINEHIHDYEIFADRIVSYITRDPILKEHVHSHKKRTKDMDHLNEKITRKNDKLKELGHVEINKDNVMDLITDIVGIRILHLHQGQFDAIHKRLMKYVEDNGYQVSGRSRECYIDGIWNKESVDEWLTEIQIPIV